MTGVEAPELHITLRDAFNPFAVVLHYRVHEAHDLIERWVEVKNTGDTPVTLERIWSALWHLPWGGSYRLSHLSGRHIDEWRLNREPLAGGRQGARQPASHHQPPCQALVRRGSRHGRRDAREVWFGALAWSGNGSSPLR